MSEYDPVPTWHENAFLADDSDPPTAGPMNVGIEAALDNTKYLKSRIDASKCVPVVTEFLADGTITIPAGALPWIEFEGCGGGGAGGHGGISAAPAAERPDASISKPSLTTSGGGGGGGAIKNKGFAPVVPGQAYNVAIGAGGVGTDGLFGFGNNGGDTTMTRVSTADVIVTCRGAGGGHPSTPIFGAGFHAAFCPNEDNALSTGGNQNQFVFARGGRPVRMNEGEVEAPANPTIYEYMYSNQTPQAGGLGTCACWPIETAGAYGSPAPRGNDSPEGFHGGTGGTPGHHAPAGGGTTAGFFDPIGGGAGGGGGAGPYGDGGAGGDGSAAVASGASAAPAAGTSAAANSGAGGGGGGGAGGAHTHTTAGAVPGNGGSGRLRVVYFVPMAEP